MNVIMKKIQIPISFFVSLNNKIAGLENKEIQNRLNPYIPII